jgi:hypothetical protein
MVVDVSHDINALESGLGSLVHAVEHGVGIVSSNPQILSQLTRGDLAKLDNSGSGVNDPLPTVETAQNGASGSWLRCWRWYSDS